MACVALLLLLLLLAHHCSLSEPVITSLFNVTVLTFERDSVQADFSRYFLHRWAVGVLIYEICTRTTPFDDTDQLKTLFNINNLAINWQPTTHLTVQVSGTRPGIRVVPMTCIQY